MKKGYYITADGKRVNIKPRDKLDLNSMGITQLVIPYGVKEVICYENNIRELIIPDTVEEIWCWDNHITNLVLPDNLVFISCELGSLGDISKYKNRKIRILLYV